MVCVCGHKKMCGVFAFALAAARRRVNALGLALVFRLLLNTTLLPYSYVLTTSTVDDSNAPSIYDSSNRSHDSWQQTPSDQHITAFYIL